MLIDIHVNAVTDDGDARNPRQVLDEIRKAGFDGVVVAGRPGELDTGTWEAERGEDDPALFFALPITTAHARFLCVPSGPLDRLVPPAWLDPEAEPPTESALLERLEKASAAVIVAQPYERTHAPVADDEVLRFEGLHAIEVRTSHSDLLAADLAVEAGLGLRLACVAGSASGRHDPHIGVHATLVPGVVHGQSELAALLRDGEAWPVTVARPQRNRSRRRRRR